MRLTFIRDTESQIIVNGDMREIETVPSTVPDKVRAVQVYTTYTEVENADLSNDVYSDPPAYVQQLIAAWEQAKAEQEAAEQEAGAEDE